MTFIDVPASVFLPGFFILAAVAHVVVRVLDKRLRDVPARGASRSLSPVEVAYLADGPMRAVLTALTALRVKKLVEIRPLRLLVDELPGDLTPLERAVGSAGSSVASPLGLWHLVRESPEIVEVRRKLERAGFLLDDALARPVRTWTAAVWGTVGLIGLLRTVSGAAHGKPVGFILIATLVCAFLALRRFRRRHIRSLDGDALLAEVRAKANARRYNTAGIWGSGDTSVLFVALDGPSADTSSSGISASFSDSGSSWGGDSSSSGDSGGGCGGGCGGCGGGD